MTAPNTDTPEDVEGLVECVRRGARMLREHADYRSRVHSEGHGCTVREIYADTLADFAEALAALAALSTQKTSGKGGT